MVAASLLFGRMTPRLLSLEDFSAMLQSVVVGWYLPYVRNAMIRSLAWCSAETAKRASAIVAALLPVDADLNVVDPHGWIRAWATASPSYRRDVHAALVYAQDPRVVRLARMLNPRLEGSEHVHLAMDPVVPEEELQAHFAEPGAGGRSYMLAIAESMGILKRVRVGRRVHYAVQRALPTPIAFGLALRGELQRLGRREASEAWVATSDTAMCWGVAPSQVDFLLTTVPHHRLLERSFLAGSPRILVQP